MKTIRGQLTGVAQERLLVGASQICQKLDWDGCRLVGNYLGLLAFAMLGTRRQLGLDNIRLALGVSNRRANQILRRSCVNYGMTFSEFLHMPAASPASIRDVISRGSGDHILNALEEGKGAILLCAHLGNWELMGALAAQHFPISVVTRPMNNKRTQDYFDQGRLKHGIEILHKSDDTRIHIKRLRQNHALALLPDQYAGERGDLMPFFGRPTRVWTSVPRLAMVSGAPIVPSFGVRQKPFLTKGRIVSKVMPGWKVEKTGDREANVQEGLRRMLWELESIIRAHPEQWLWLHRRWRPQDLEQAKETGNS